MPSYFDVDVNCPSCFNDVLQALASTDGVDAVEGDISNGCITVTHRVDESSLQSIINQVGRTIELAGNGEYVMAESHVGAAHVCAHGTLADIVNANPSLTRELERIGLDYCCGGAATLSQACAEQGLDTAAVIDQLTAQRTDDPPPTWSTMGVVQLVDHIESTHHRYLWDEMPRLSSLFDKVVNAHGANHPELDETRQVYTFIRADLEPHLTKEERILFPMIRQLATATRPLTPGPGSVRGPISVMLSEHDALGELLGDLRTLTNEYSTPADGCASYAALFDGLAALEADTHLHIHKENNLLFPAVTGLEQRLVP